MDTNEERVSRRSPRGSRWFVTGTLGALALVAAACSSGSATPSSTTAGGSSSTAGGSAASTAGGSGSSGSAAVVLTGHTSNGTLLTNSAGLTLYHFTADGTGAPKCTGSCNSLWPALTVPAGTTHPAAGSGVSAASLGTVALADGTLQVTFKGMPLYRYSADNKAGDTNGQGVLGMWFDLKTSTTSTAPAATTPPTTAKPSGGYGY